jgi:hypothetical protein
MIKLQFIPPCARKFGNQVIFNCVLTPFKSLRSAIYLHPKLADELNLPEFKFTIFKKPGNIFQ